MGQDIVTTDAMKALVAESMMKALDEQVRGKLITDAIAYLMTEKDPPGGYSYGKKSSSPLQDLFRQHLEQATREIVKEELAKSDVKERLRQIVVDAIGKLTIDLDKMAWNLADTISKALSRDG